MQEIFGSVESPLGFSPAKLTTQLGTVLQTYSPGVGKLLSPLLVNSLPVFPLESTETDVEHGETNRGKASLVQDNLGQ